MLASESDNVKESVAVDISKEASKEAPRKCRETQNLRKRNRRRKRKSCLSEACIHTFRTGVEGIGA